MRCPKCGYVSFDYNQTCPKCNKDISSEKAKIGLTSFKPIPPSLLGVLTGEANESHTDLNIDGLSNLGNTGKMDINQDDSDGFEMDDMAIDEGDESLDFSAEDGSLENASIEDDLDMDLDDSGSLDDDTLDIDQSVLTEPNQESDMELDLDIGGENEVDSLNLEEPLSEEPGQDDSLEIELNAISLDTNEMAKLEVNEEMLETPELSPDEESISSGSDNSDLGESAMIELDLDDLKIDKTGQLEIKDKAEFSEGLKKLTKSKNGNTKDEKSNNKVDINLKIDDDELNMDLEKLDLEIDIEKPEDKVL
jgi:hypothetical protein